MCGKSTWSPGAVPIGLFIILVFSGKIAILIRGLVISTGVGKPRFFAYWSHRCFTISKASGLTASLQFRALATPCRVLSSNVGPRPPVVMMNLGFRANTSLIVSPISSMMSWITVMRLTLTAKTVACLASQCALVFSIFPIRSSLPMQMISMSMVKVVPCLCGCVELL